MQIGLSLIFLLVFGWFLLSDTIPVPVPNQQKKHLGAVNPNFGHANSALWKDKG